MFAINWQQYGLRANPYDTNALTEGGDIPLERSFVGRDDELVLLNGLFESQDRIALVIGGEPGVGKTSLANYHKFLWKKKTPKLLFSFRREIEAREDILDQKNFLIEVIASIIKEITLLDNGLLRDPLLERLSRLVDITYDLALSAELSGGYTGLQGGVSYGRSKSTQAPMAISATVLREYFLKLIEWIKTHEIGGQTFSGLVVHVNNFDVLFRHGKEEKVRFFLDDIRDVLQTKDVYFLFVGPNELHGIIQENQRVRSVFSPHGITLRPLSKRDMVEAFRVRIDELKSKGVATPIKPIDDDTVYKIYDLYAGDIRETMKAITDLLGEYADRPAKTLMSNEALVFLGRERWQRVLEKKLSDKQLEALQILASEPNPISATEFAKKHGMQTSNVVQRYFQPYRECGIIEDVERDGKTVRVELMTTYKPLRWFLEAKPNAEKQEKLRAEQDSLFGELL